MRAVVSAGWEALRRVAETLGAICKEIADENAYDRHLKACGRAASGEEWRRFSDHRLRTKYARGKCC